MRLIKMTIDELMRISLIREKVNERQIKTNEEASELVSLLFTKFTNDRTLKVDLEEWFIENNIPLNNLLCP